MRGKLRVEPFTDGLSCRIRAEVLLLREQVAQRIARSLELSKLAWAAASITFVQKKPGTLAFTASSTAAR